MQDILKQYENKQTDAISATIKLNKVTDNFLKDLKELEKNFKI